MEGADELPGASVGSKQMHSATALGAMVVLVALKLGAAEGIPEGADEAGAPNNRNCPHWAVGDQIESRQVCK